MSKRQKKKTTTIDTQITGFDNVYNVGRVLQDLGKNLDVINSAGVQQIQQANKSLSLISESFRLKLMQDDILGQLSKALSLITSQWRIIDLPLISKLSPFERLHLYPRVLELSENLADTEEALEVITPEVIEGSLQEIGQDETNRLQKQLAETMEEVKNLRSKIETIEASINIPALQAKNKDGKAKRGANRGTLDDIRALAKFREDYIKEKKTYPAWLLACQSVPIDPATAKHYAPQLRKNWKMLDYHWDESFEN